jgi:hypothetical protein
MEKFSTVVFDIVQNITCVSILFEFEEELFC